MDALRSIRPLKPDSLRGIEPSKDIGPLPTVEMVKPSDLYVEDTYQRQVGENGIKLIRRIYAGFNWSRFKPPICVRVAELDNLLICIDGQHTAIACASHPEIDLIPVLIVPAASAAARAHAFVGHNRDRLGLTQMAIYHAEVAGGDPIALTMAEALKEAGAEILHKSVNLKQRLPAGQTIAVGTIRNIAKSKGGNFLAGVLKVLVAAKRGPMKADEIAATASVLETSPNTDRAALAALIASMSAEAWAASLALHVANSGCSLPSALSRAWLDLSAPVADQTGSGARQPGGPGDVGTRKSNENQSASPGVTRGVGLGNHPSVARQASAGRPGPIGEATRLPPRERVVAALPRPVTRAPPAEAPKPPTIKKAAPAPAPRAAAALPAKVAMLDGTVDHIIARNGITLDLRTREVTHRGHTVAVPSDDGVRLVAYLAKVMPTLLDESRVVKATFGTLPADGGIRLQGVIESIAPALRRAELEVKKLHKMGYRLHAFGGE